MKSQWVIYEEDKELQSVLSKGLNISDITSQILINRGFRDIEVIKKFLNINLHSLSFPLLLKDIEKACDRIIFAIKRNEKILVYGDYDVDGITSVSLLINFFHAIGYHNVDFYIPERLIDGYGLNLDILKKFRDNHVKLIITVDCGISNNVEIEYASSLGMDVIVTDHHEPPDELPNAFAIIDPKQKNCNFPFRELAGVGIAFYLLAGLRMKFKDINLLGKEVNINLKQFLDLVALGTIADICPLHMDNRILVKYGLKELEKGERKGIKALKQLCGIKEGQMNYWSVGFRIAPRINAVGRLNKAGLGVELLTTDNYSDALKIASFLDKSNYERQKIEEKILRQALSMVEKTGGFQNRNSIVLYSDSWHEGVIGIVASKIVEKYYKPTILITFKGGKGKGSARSIRDFDLYEGLNLCSEFLESFGGHKFAAGLSIKRENLNAFIDAFERTVSGTTKPSDFIRKSFIDKKVEFQEIEADLIKEFNMLEPFGHSNTEPTLLTEDVLVTSVKVFGTNHVRLILEQGKNSFEALAFNKSSMNVTIGDSLNVSYYPFSYKENGSADIKLKIKNMEII
jgi:single-stranded-DNA-specific exonuclease